MEIIGVFLFKIIINVLIIYFRLIWIPMLWVYGHLYRSESDVYRRQILTSVYVIFWCINTVLALKGLDQYRVHGWCFYDADTSSTSSHQTFIKLTLPPPPPPRVRNDKQESMAVNASSIFNNYWWPCLDPYYVWFITMSTLSVSHNTSHPDRISARSHILLH